MTPDANVMGSIVPVTSGLKGKIYTFKVALITELVVLIPLLLFGFIWIFIQLLSVAVGYYAIWDPQFLRPALIQLHFVLTVVGTVLAGADTALSISNVAETGLLSQLWLTGLWVVALLILLVASVLSWKLYKAVLLPPVSHESLRPYMTAVPPPATTTSTGEFVPFQGAGHKLGP